MSIPPPSKKGPYVRRSSGEVAVVKQMRAKFESINEHTQPLVDALRERVDRLNKTTTPVPPKSVVPGSDPEVNQDDIDTEPVLEASEPSSDPAPPTSDPEKDREHKPQS